MAAWYIPNNDAEKAIILIHGRNASKQNAISGTFPKLAAEICFAGLAVLMVDLRAHGESDGNLYMWGEHEWHAIRDLGASRIGHAVNIMGDSALIDFMREKGIGIEANLTSNVHTNTVPSYQAHPLKKQLDLGLLATINTDDLGISPVTLRYEFEVAAPKAGLNADDTRKAQENALKIAFLSEKERAFLQDKMQLC